MVSTFLERNRGLEQLQRDNLGLMTDSKSIKGYYKIRGTGLLFLKHCEERIMYTNNELNNRNLLHISGKVSKSFLLYHCCLRKYINNYNVKDFIFNSFCIYQAQWCVVLQHFVALDRSDFLFCFHATYVQRGLIFTSRFGDGWPPHKKISTQKEHSKQPQQTNQIKP